MSEMFKILFPFNILSSTYSENYCLNLSEVKLTYFENSDFYLNSGINVCEISIKTLLCTEELKTHRQNLIILKLQRVYCVVSIV